MVKHPGYRTFNNTRKENKNGGVCIMVNNEISHGVKQYKTNLCDVIVCRLEKSFFGLPREVFLVNSYVKPANTSKERICKWCIRNSHIEEIEDESHLLISCALNDDIRNNLITKARGFLTDHDHTTTQQLDIAQLTNSSSQLFKSVSPENQAHLCRMTACYISDAFSNSEKFIDSIKAT
jgi:hypothetical protein